MYTILVKPDPEQPTLTLATDLPDVRTAIKTAFTIALKSGFTDSPTPELAYKPGEVSLSWASSDDGLVIRIVRQTSKG